MPNVKLAPHLGKQLSPRSLVIWRIVQSSVWVVGITILTCLLFFPSIGLVLFWDILIPVAPALLVVATGLWRNICPLATTILLPRHLGLSKRRRLSITQLGKLNLIGVIALYAIVPLRHAVFNASGLATGILIISLAVIGTITSFFYEWKSAWCSGLCPIHPVEKLYGGNTLVSLPNAHCNKCMNCVIPCPDSTPNVHPKSSTKSIYHKISGWMVIGGLPGFIWGWFHVPDAQMVTSISGMLGVYSMPLVGFATTLAAYGILSAIIPKAFGRRLISIFAALGVSCYYWYRIPALLGFGKFASDGLLVNLKNVLPAWCMPIITVATTIFFFYWLVVRKQNNRSWIIRPEYGTKPEMVARKMVG